MAADPVAFNTRDDDKIEGLIRARRVLARYNATGPEDADERRTILTELFGELAPGVWVEPPFYCDFGDNIRFGPGCFVNLNCVILDGAAVEIGAGTLLGPGVQIYATSHPMDPDARIYEVDGVPSYRTFAKPVVIGERVWIGGGAMIMPGVHVGDGSTIGAGAVVTKDVPERVFVAGNPARVIRRL